MTNGGIQVRTEAPGSAHADLGFWLASQVIGQPMAMNERHLTQLVETVVANRFVLPKNRKTGARITEKGTAIVEVHGILINRAPVLGSFWGLTPYEGLTEQFRRLATNDDVKRIVLDIDSPGGLVAGLESCGEALEKLAAKKPVVALAHDMAASAAYYLACIADELIVTKDAEVGSIGVRAGHVSYAEQLDRAGITITQFSAGATKTDGNPYELLSPGAAAEEQFAIDRCYDHFVCHVAANRPLSEQDVRDTDARCVRGDDAVEAKLADGVDTLEDLVERLEKNASRVKRKKRSTEPGSRAGKIPPERVPARPDDDEPAAGKQPRTGARLMSEHQSAESTDLADMIAAAITGMKKPAAVTAAPAPVVQQPTAAELADKAATAAVGRVFAVLDCDEAKDRPKLARALAGAGLDVEAAKPILAAAAKEETPKAADTKVDDQKALDNALDRQMAKPGNSAAVKPEASGTKSRPSFVEVAAASAKKS